MIPLSSILVGSPFACDSIRCDAPGLFGNRRAAYHLITTLPRLGGRDHDPPAPVRWQDAQPVSVHIFARAARWHGARRRGAARGGWCAAGGGRSTVSLRSASPGRDGASAG